MSVRYKIFCVALAIASLAVAALAFDAWRWYVDAVADGERETQNLATVFADHTSRTVQPVYEALDVLEVNVDALLGPNHDAADQRVRARLGHLPQLLWFAVVDAHGVPVATMQSGARDSLGNLSGLPWFARHLDGGDRAHGGNIFGPPMKGAYTGNWFIPVTRAVRNPDGSLKAVVATAVDVRYFAALYSTIDVGRSGSITLFDDDGTIVARHPDHDGFVGRSAKSGRLFSELLPHAPRGLMRLTTAVDGRTVLGAYRRVPDYPLVISVLYGEDDMFAAWRRSLPFYGLAAAAIVAFAGIAAFGVTRAAENAKALAVAQKEVEVVQASERELVRARESLAHAQRIGNMGNWDWDMVTNEIAWSDQVYRIFGLTPQQFGASYPAFLERVHPDDRAAVERGVREALEGKPYALDHRVVRTDGTVRIVHEEGEVVRDANGRPTGLRGIVLDITNLREAESAQRKSEMRLSGILGISPEAIIAVDQRGVIQLFNAGAEQIFGHAAADAIGQPLAILLPKRFRAAHHGMMRAFGDGDETSRLMSRRGRISGVRKDGTEFPAEASIAKLQVGDEWLFTVILRDITDRVADERALIAAKEEAELSSRAKSEFLANISHELRTPLNAIIGFSEMMATEPFGPLGNNRYKAYAADIRSSGQHLLSVINDILDVSKIEAGRMDLDEREVDLWRTIAASVALVQGRADQRSIALDATPGPVRPRVRGDERKIKQIVINLLSNAVKFTPVGGRVSVTVAVEDGWACVRIMDTGIGIPEDRLAQLARPFVQVESGLNRRYEGTGLGLALSKALAELHQGRLVIESAVGQGTTVTLRLPPERLLDASVEARGSSDRGAPSAA
ncbi:MAG: PAS domain S-box protein [Gemmatimonas sp.]